MNVERETGLPHDDVLTRLLFVQSEFVRTQFKEPKCMYVGHVQYVALYQDKRCSKYITRLDGYNNWAFNGCRIIEVMADNHMGIA